MDKQQMEVKNFLMKAYYCLLYTSTSTSRLLYALKRIHFSLSCCGRLRVLPPFVLVALHGVQKKRISSFPVSYTHLDVYKRQGMHMAVPDLG